MNTEYFEITAIGKEHREFLDALSGKTVKCLCLYYPLADRTQWMLADYNKPEAHVKDCPIHGW